MSTTSIPRLWRTLARQYGADLAQNQYPGFAIAGTTIYVGTIHDYRGPTKHLPLVRHIAFFHELGHLVTPSRFHRTHTKLESEHEAWRQGLRLATKHGFPPDAWPLHVLVWAKEQLSSYLAYDQQDVPRLYRWLTTREAVLENRRLHRYLEKKP